MNHFLKHTLITVNLLLLTTAVKAQAETEFITLWKPGTTNPQSIELPIVGDNMTITWEEVGHEAAHSGAVTGIVTDNSLDAGTATLVDLGNAQNPNPAEATYRIKVTGGLQRFLSKKNSSTELQKLMEIQQWGSTAWQSMEDAFSDCANVQLTATDVPDLENVTDMSAMFSNATAFTGNASMNSWNTENVTNMSSMFAGAAAFNQPIGDWNTKNVTNMGSMFAGAAAFNQPIGNWNTGKVFSMRFMFRSAAAFNQPIGGWNTTSVTNMYAMFNRAADFNQPIGNWNTENVRTMRDMFANTSAFNQAISGWNTGKVTDMHGMFSDAAAFNQPIASWNTENVTNMGNMFESADAFNQPLGSLNTANVQDMHDMFRFASSFDQSLADWNLSAATDMNDMISSSGLSCVNYGRTLIGWAKNTTTTPLNIEFEAANMVYSHEEAVAARENLINTKNWNISGDTYNSTACRDKPLPVTFGDITATITNGVLHINWQTLSETNIDHFEIETSADGKVWSKAGSNINSKAANGSSDTSIQYAEKVALKGVAAMGISLLLLSMSLMLHRRKWLTAVLIIAGISALCYGCTKNKNDLSDREEKIYVRIKQVDKDGTARYSKVITAVVK